MRNRKFYSSKEWVEIRNFIRSRDVICIDCKNNGLINQGREVHHIIPINTDWEKRYDLDNLVLLCHECHDAKHNRISPFQKFMIDRV